MGAFLADLLALSASDISAPDSPNHLKPRSSISKVEVTMRISRFCVSAAIALSCIVAFSAQATPAEVIIIRHAEKPATGNQLDTRGLQRAQALVDLFTQTPALTVYGTPVAIFAMSPSSPTGSVRSIQTVTPLAENLGLTLNKTMTRDEITKLVAAIRSEPAYDGKMVLICWEHKVIPAIVEAFGWQSAPVTWADAVFDRIWILKFNGDTVTSFSDLPQHVLPGDSET